MSKRKKAHKPKVTRRRRRVSGMKAGNFDVMGTLLTIGGAVAGKIITNTLARQSNATMVKAAPYAPLLLGIIGVMMVKNDMVKKISAGMIAEGGVTALGSTGLKVIKGFDNAIAGVGYPGRAPMIAYNNNRMIAGPAGSQGLAAGTRSNFSGSRMSQMNTIAGVAAACGC